MTFQKAYYVGTSYNHFKPFEPAEIIGVQMVAPSIADEPRPCYLIQFANMVEDRRPIVGDEGTFVILTMGEIADGAIERLKKER